MNRFNGMMRNHFKGYKKLIEIPHKFFPGVIISIYFIEREDLVGVSTGFDAFVAPPGSCFHAHNLVNLVRRELPRKRVRLLPITTNVPTEEK